MAYQPIYKESGQTFRADANVMQRRALAEGTLQLTALARGQYPGVRLRRDDLQGIRCLGVWNVARPQPWGTEWHRNEGLEICYLESGDMPLLIDDRKHRLRLNELSLTRPWQLHRLGDPGIPASRLHYLVLDVGVRRPNQSWSWPPWIVLLRRDLEELTHLLRHIEEPVIPAGKEIKSCFQRIAQQARLYETTDTASYLQALVNELLALILYLLRQSPIRLNQALSGRRHTVDLFLQDLANNLDSLREEWSVESMARRCGVSPSTFLYYCKDLTNLPPSEYLTRCRLEQAAALLRGMKMNVTEAAFACGFHSSQYFATVFRKIYKCSPSEYLQRAP